MMRSLDFDEKRFIVRDQTEEVQQLQRKVFMDRVLRRLAEHPSKEEVWKMSLTMSRPNEHADEINQFIHFAIFMGVKHLEFNFFDPNLEQNGAVSFSLPKGVYQQNENLEYLKLHWCSLDFTRFTSLQNLKTISLGWSIITTDQLRYLLASCPILETLKLKRCVGMEWLFISVPNSMLKNLAFDGCISQFLVLDGPKLRMFEYSGKVVPFLMSNQSELVEARLDFSMQEKFERVGFHLFHLMQQLIAVRFMTVCSAFLQIISTENLSIRIHLNLNVQYLTMNTALHVNEFIGIRFMLSSCTQLNNLTLCLVPGRIFDDYAAPPYPIDLAHFWSWTPRVETCLLQSLQVLNVRGFGGSPNEMSLIRYIMHLGRCLRSVNLYLAPVQLDDHVKREELESKSSLLMQSPRANPNLQISVARNFQ